MRLYLILFFLLVIAFMYCNRPQPLLTDPRVKARAEVETQKILAKEPKEEFDVHQAEPSAQSKKDDDDDDFAASWYMNPANPAGPIGSMMFDD